MNKQSQKIPCPPPDSFKQDMRMIIIDKGDEIDIDFQVMSGPGERCCPPYCSATYKLDKGKSLKTKGAICYTTRNTDAPIKEITRTIE